MPMEDILTNKDYMENPVPLSIYNDQVGGHSSLLCLDERTVCKPLIKQELKFYELIPGSMKKFTPEYRGCIEVRFQEDEDGYITVAAFPPKSFRYQLSNNKKLPKSRRIRLKNSGSIEIEIESELHELFVEEDGSSSSITSRSQIPVRPHNPWVLKCHRDHLSKIKRGSGGSSHSQKEKEPHSQKFILLENLTTKYEYPCVLDLKMGTRQYGDDATPAKIESQIAKAASSTSQCLGVRICGMQVYQTTTGKFLCRNKYYGRKLTVDGFGNALRQFLHNGNRLRTDALIPLVEKLQELKAVLLTLDTFRFYTSSLLLIYEGLDPELNGDDEPQVITEEEQEECDNDVVKMDESEPQECSIPVPPKSSRSVENICRANSQDGTTTIPHMNGSNSSEGLNNVTSSTNNYTNTGLNSSTTSSSTRSSRSHLGSSRGSTPTASLSSESVDVRMIDFAHATHSGLDLDHCAKEHSGPDTGYIFGLSNLIKALQEIIDEECSN